MPEQIALVMERDTTIEWARDVYAYMRDVLGHMQMDDGIGIGVAGGALIELASRLQGSASKSAESRL